MGGAAGVFFVFFGGFECPALFLPAQNALNFDARPPKMPKMPKMPKCQNAKMPKMQKMQKIQKRKEEECQMEWMHFESF